MPIMTRSPQKRVRNVEDDIVALTPPLYQNAMGLWIDNYWNTATGGNATALKTLSNLMTMTDVANPGNEAERAQRRALIFLEALKANSSLPAAKTTSPHFPAQALPGI